MSNKLTLPQARAELEQAEARLRDARRQHQALANQAADIALRIENDKALSPDDLAELVQERKALSETLRSLERRIATEEHDARTAKERVQRIEDEVAGRRRHIASLEFDLSEQGYYAQNIDKLQRQIAVFEHDAAQKRQALRAAREHLAELLGQESV